MDEQESPQLMAMRAAMKQAEEAAEQRRLAKLKAQESGGDFRHDMDTLEDLQVIAETRVYSEFEELPPAFETFSLAEDEDLGQLIEQLDAEIPDPDNIERHGDLVVFKPEDPAQPWYTLAGEEALPAALQGMKGPLDVKRLLHALMVEVGDVKRTNAIIMDQLLRLEEKVDRTNRLLKERRYPH